MSLSSITVQGIVLKRINIGEADRIVTLYTKELGKVAVVAKGVRKINSSQAAALEIGQVAKCHLIFTQALPILTQATPITRFIQARTHLIGITQTYQLLEIIDLLTVEQQENESVYQLAIDTLSLLESPGAKKAIILENIRLILKDMGFTHDKVFTETSLKEYIEDLGNRRLRSKTFLTP
jgi:DNA repair protein RecO (recombination protein O)